MGRMERINISFVRCTSFAPSRRCVVRSSTRVPTAYSERWLRSYENQCGLVKTYRKAEVEGDEKNGELEVEGVVQIIVIDDDG